MIVDPTLADVLMVGGALVGSGSGAWIGLKAALNGTKARVEKIERTTDRIDRTVADTNTRLAVLEVKHNLLEEKCAGNHK